MRWPFLLLNPVANRPLTPFPLRDPFPSPNDFVIDYTPYYDGRGDVAGTILASDGTSATQYEYGPFGELLRTTGPMAHANAFRFSTKYTDEDAQLIYYGYRFFQPQIGRWLSRDPLAESGGLNLYGFVRNRPAMAVDALGLLGPDEDIKSYDWPDPNGIASGVQWPPGQKGNVGTITVSVSAENICSDAKPGQINVSVFAKWNPGYLFDPNNDEGAEVTVAGKWELAKSYGKGFATYFFKLDLPRCPKGLREDKFSIVVRDKRYRPLSANQNRHIAADVHYSYKCGGLQDATTDLEKIKTCCHEDEPFRSSQTLAGQHTLEDSN